MKTAFLILGFNMNVTAADKKYAELRAAITARGYEVVLVPFVWNYQKQSPSTWESLLHSILNTKVTIIL